MRHLRMGQSLHCKQGKFNFGGKKPAVSNKICIIEQSWIVQMGVHNLPKKDKQPFYNVLVGDGSMRYAAQENLVPLPGEWSKIRHRLLGKYFDQFQEGYYVPNEQLAARYPEDIDYVRSKFTNQ